MKAISWVKPLPASGDFDVVKLAEILNALRDMGSVQLIIQGWPMEQQRAYSQRPAVPSLRLVQTWVVRNLNAAAKGKESFTARAKELEVGNYDIVIRRMMPTRKKPN